MSIVAEANPATSPITPTKIPDTAVNAYLLFWQDSQILLHLRKNTGYFDSYYDLVSGHVEKGESATTAIIRESFEEAGLILKSENLKVVHVLHRKTDRLTIDIFFECAFWEGPITNKESDKCAALEFFSPSELPVNTIDYVKEVIHKVRAGCFYSEEGW